MNVFSGMGWMGAPSGLRGGGTRNSGDGGNFGERIETVLLNDEGNTKVDGLLFLRFGHEPPCGIGDTK